MRSSIWQLAVEREAKCEKVSVDCSNGNGWHRIIHELIQSSELEQNNNRLYEPHISFGTSAHVQQKSAHVLHQKRRKKAA